MEPITIHAAGKDRILNVRPDAPDLMDRFFEPSLNTLAKELDNSNPKMVLDQGQEGACTGFGLAAAIDFLKFKRGETVQVSARMLYEMAQKHDEWPGEDYDGSSCRGAIKGWKNMGVCRDELWPYIPDNPGQLTIEKAKDARSTILGAYYRLHPVLNDYHAALNEVGVIYVSANVHKGWFAPTKASTNDKFATIIQHSDLRGGHAFAIVGYTDLGFIIQNSWGNDWGTNGFAIWTYEDWYHNVSDGWVFRLAVATPLAFGLTTYGDTRGKVEFGGKAPKRIEIAGHFAHFDDGCLKNKGNYWSTFSDIQLTIDRVKRLSSKGEIKHLLIYAHGGLNSPKSSAIRIKAMKDGFKRNGIYPFHLMYDTGLAEEIKDLVKKSFNRSSSLFDQWKDKIQDASDNIIEDLVRKSGTALWEEIKHDAKGPFLSKNSDGVKIINKLLDAISETNVKIHLVGHSTGSILIGHLLKGLDGLSSMCFDSCSLLAPACSLDFYNQYYDARIINNQKGIVSVKSLNVYNLSDELEMGDNVAWAYRKSLLYLVSNAFERSKSKPLLGMAKYIGDINNQKLKFIISDGKGDITRSTSHGGFDNDSYTLNSVLKTILESESISPFTENELKY